MHFVKKNENVTGNYLSRIISFAHNIDKSNHLSETCLQLFPRDATEFLNANMHYSFNIKIDDDDVL